MKAITPDILDCLLQSNTKLPDCSFFTYRGIEIIDFSPDEFSIELVNGAFINCTNMVIRDISLSHDMINIKE